MTSTVVERDSRNFNWTLAAINGTLFRQRLNLARSNGEFADVCLKIQSSEKTFNAHQVILSAGSEILNMNLATVEGLTDEDLEDILTYIYVGSVQVSQDRLNSFLKAAKALGVFKNKFIRSVPEDVLFNVKDEPSEKEQLEYPMEASNVVRQEGNSSPETPLDLEGIPFESDQ